MPHSHAPQMRLLQHKGDLVCGMDFHVDVREGWDRHWRNIPAAQIMPYGPYGPELGVRHMQDPFLRSWHHQSLSAAYWWMRT